MRNQQAGDPAHRITIRDVARHAAVSPATVSRVVNNYPSVNHETASRVRDAIAATGWIPDPGAAALSRMVPLIRATVTINGTQHTIQGDAAAIAAITAALGAVVA